MVPQCLVITWMLVYPETGVTPFKPFLSRDACIKASNRLGPILADVVCIEQKEWVPGDEVPGNFCVIPQPEDD